MTFKKKFHLVTCERLMEKKFFFTGKKKLDWKAIKKIESVFISTSRNQVY